MKYFKKYCLFVLLKFIFVLATGANSTIAGQSQNFGKIIPQSTTTPLSTDSILVRRNGNWIYTVALTSAVAINTGFAYRILPGEMQITSTIAQGVNPVNQIRFWRFRLPLATRLVSIHFNVLVGAASRFLAIGIYSFNGSTKLVDSGAVSATGTGIRNITLASPIVLIPGDYILAWTCDHLTPKFSTTNSSTDQNSILNAGVPQLGTCSNVSAAGVLPATLGTLTGADINIPIVKLQQ